MMLFDKSINNDIVILILTRALHIKTFLHMKKLSISIALLAVSLVSRAQWYIETVNFKTPKSHDTAAGGTQYWHNANKNNWLSLDRSGPEGDTINLVLIDYDRVNHPDTITSLKLYLDKNHVDRWIMQSMYIQKYPNKKRTLVDPGPQEFMRLVEKITTRIKS